MNDNTNPFGQPPAPKPKSDANGTPSPFAQPVQSAQPADNTMATNQPQQSSQPNMTFPNVAPVNMSNQSTLQPTTQPSSMMPPASTPKPTKSHKNLIIGVSVAAAAVILIVVGVVVFIGMGKVSADDYQTAVSEMNDLYDYLDDFDDKFDDIDTDDVTSDELNSTIDEALGMLDEGSTRIDEVGKSKAVSRDDEAKKAFDTMKSSYAVYSDKSKKALNMIKQLIPLIDVMNKMNDVDFDSDTYYTDITTVYKNLSSVAGEIKVDDSTIAAAVADVKDGSAKLAAYYEKYAKYRSGESNEYPSYSEISGVSSDLSSAFTKIGEVANTSDIVKAGNNFTDAFNDLNQLLEDKYYELEYGI